MKRLTKVLGFFALFIVISALLRSTGIIFADTGGYTIAKVDGSKWNSVQNSPDVNIKLRGSQPVDGQKTLVKINGPTDPIAPQLCTLFSTTHLAPIVNLYAIGRYQGLSSGTESDPPHLVDFQTTPGENIRLPWSGYDIGGGYGAMVVYADSDSIALHYENTDGTVDGYALHLLNFNVSPALLTLYNQNASSRDVLPVVMPGQTLGTARGSTITVSIRDTGSFMDPRSVKDWWSKCDANGNYPQVDKSGKYGPSKNQAVQNFPPLNSIVACPPETPTVGEITTESTTPNNTGTSSCPVPLQDEPELCKHPEQAAVAKDFCGGIGNRNTIAWCNIKSCEKLVAYAKEHGPICYSEAKDKDTTGNCGHYTKGYCDGQDIGVDKNPPTDGKRAGPYWGYRSNLTCRNYDGSQDFGDSAWEVGRCQSHYIADGISSPTVTPSPSPTKTNPPPSLPVCIPTTGTNTRCVTECSEPVKFNESLTFNNLGSCLKAGNCNAQIGIKNEKGDNALAIPFAKDLGNYFAGTLDAEHSTPEELDQAAADLVGNDPIARQNAMNKLGVVKKLYPPEVQDNLKCDFVKYVADKYVPGSDKPKTNTKYIYKLNGKPTIFSIRGVPVIEFAANGKYKCPPALSDTVARTAWNNTVAEKTTLGVIWRDMPLIPDDESQGKIEFVSPTLYSLKPVQVSIPEIQRLDAATRLVQAALIPIETITGRDLAITTTPQVSIPTIGKTIPIPPDNSCSPSRKIEDYYSKSITVTDELGNPVKGNNGQTLTEYSRGVECALPDLAGAPTSKICIVDQQGQVKCSFTKDLSPQSLSKMTENTSETVQVRTTFPHLFDIAEQTIGHAAGVFNVFKPNIVKAGKQQGTPEKDTFKEIEDAYNPVPASINQVHYSLPSFNNLSIDDSSHKDSGWKVFFYKLGGLWNANNFVLKTLAPTTQGIN